MPPSPMGKLSFLTCKWGRESFSHQLGRSRWWMALLTLSSGLPEARRKKDQALELGVLSQCAILQDPSDTHMVTCSLGGIKPSLPPPIKWVTEF